MAKRKDFPNIKAFCRKWERKFFAAIEKVIEYIREEDSSFEIDGPYTMCEDETAVFGFSVRKGKGHRREEFLDVWATLEPVYDEDPIKFWPILGIHETEKGEFRSVNLSDSLADLHDEKSIEFIIKDILSHREWLLAKLKDYEWPRKGVLDWRPEDEDPQGPSMGATDEYLKFATPLALEALEEISRHLVGAGLITSPAQAFHGDGIWSFYVLGKGGKGSLEIALFHLSDTDTPQIRFFDYHVRGRDGEPTEYYKEDLWERPINRQDRATTKRMFSRATDNAKTYADVFLVKRARKSVLEWRPEDEV